MSTTRAFQATRRRIPNVNKIIAVSSCKGGVGKSTIAMNLAFTLASSPSLKLRVGLLDLDIFGPSVPSLLGISTKQNPVATTPKNALIPLTNHGIRSMSLAYLLSTNPQQPVVWRGLMVQKAVQNLLFDVDWAYPDPTSPLDALVIDLPPGTGDVPLTLGQLVKVDGSIIVSSPQRVSISDVEKGISMFNKLQIPVSSLLLNYSHVTLPCSNCRHSQKYPLFGNSSLFDSMAQEHNLEVGARLPIVQGVSQASDAGLPYALSTTDQDDPARQEWLQSLNNLATSLWHQVNL